jgi:hypothetical protein
LKYQIRKTLSYVEELFEKEKPDGLISSKVSLFISLEKISLVKNQI